MMMQLGADGVFVGSGIFNPGILPNAAAIVAARPVRGPGHPGEGVARGLGEAMVGINVEEIPEPHRLAERGW